MLERMLCPELRFEKVQQARRVSLDALEALDPLAQGLDLPGDFGPVQPVLGQDLGISLVPDAVADLAELPVMGCTHVETITGSIRAKTFFIPSERISSPGRYTKPFFFRLGICTSACKSHPTRNAAARP